METVSITTKS